MQKPKVVLDQSTKSLLDSKKQDGQSYDSIIKSLISDQANSIYSIASQQGGGSEIIGASAGDQAFGTYEKTLAWVTDTRRKLPGDETDWGTNVSGLTPDQREDAYNKDPLVKGIVCPFLKNVILGTFNIITDDNKKYDSMVSDIEDFLSNIKFMEVARDSFEDYAIKHGKSYWRKDYKNGILDHLQALDAKSTLTHIDAFNSDIRAHHQRIRVNKTWNSNNATSTTESNSWFVPEGEILIEEDDIGNEAAWAKWNVYKTKYNISETAGLRVGASEDIIDMHKGKIGDPAPIDAAILAIWLKRLVIANSPNVIFSTLVPFMHMQFGVIMETTDPVTGQKQIITSVPQQPPASMQTTNPELYTQLQSNYTNYETAKKDSLKNLMRYRAENGLFASGPDVKLDIKQSASSITSSFIETMIRQLNEDIGQALGFPVSLILAKGAELATSRNIKDLFNTVYSGSKQDYERIAMELIEERFEGQTWDYEIEDLHGEVEKGTYTLADVGLEFVLGEMDKKDALIEAQTELVTMQSAQIAKAIGASVQDIQAYFDENEMGVWELTNYDFAMQQQEQQQQNAQQQPGIADVTNLPGMPEVPGQDQKVPEIKIPGAPSAKTVAPSTPGKPTLPADMKKQSAAEMIESTVNKKFDIHPSDVPKNKSTNLKDELMAAYDAAAEAMKGVLDEGEK